MTTLAEALADRYRIERELGRGGMATVYLATDLKHDRQVALKVLLPELAQSLGPERFQREIHFAARLQHPHILTVLDSGAAGGQLWFTMPYVEGESLRDRLRRERQLSVEESLRITREAAKALDYANEHGVVHRDIKPENILLTKDGSTLVADFGIARSIGGNEALTQTGFAVGTPAYMSPEQASGDKAVDARSDTYSLASVLYEMLAGEPPYVGGTAQAIIIKRFTEPVPSVRKIRPGVPESVDAALLRAMAPIAADRFASAGQFAQAMGIVPTPATGTPTVVASPVAATPRRRIPVAALTLILGLLVGGGLLYAWRRAPSGRTASPSAAGGGTSVEQRSVRVAVLPFENRGDSSDAYFAEGVADAVRGKLTAIQGMEVIARNSSEQYANSTKPLEEIARELGVDYILTGTVRWARQKDGTSRVQVSPELVQVGDGTAKSRWQQPFDAPMTDVFQVQADIAGKVANALNVELAPQDAQQLAGAPTRNLEAYDAYLKGLAIKGIDARSLQQRIGFYEEAVARDPGFVSAWARLAGAASVLSVARGGGYRAQALSALAEAMKLDSTNPDVYLTRVVLEANVNRDDQRSLAIAREALARGPATPTLLRVVGSAEVSGGDVSAGLAKLRQSTELDPRSLPAWRALSSGLLSVRRYEEAKVALDRALSIDPHDFGIALQAAERGIWATGDLAAAREVVAPLLSGPEASRFASFVAINDDLYWLLTPSQQDVVLAQGPESFDDDRAGRALVFAQIYGQRGDAAKARLWGDSAARYFAAEEKDNPQARTLRALSLGYAGRLDEAKRVGQEATSKDARGSFSSYPFYIMARVYTMSGEAEPAIAAIKESQKDTLNTLLRPGWLRNDPAFAALRGNPAFEALTK